MFRRQSACLTSPLRWRIDFLEVYTPDGTLHFLLWTCPPTWVSPFPQVVPLVTQLFLLELCELLLTQPHTFHKQVLLARAYKSVILTSKCLESIHFSHRYCLFLSTRHCSVHLNYCISYQLSSSLWLVIRYPPRDRDNLKKYLSNHFLSKHFCWL